MITFRMNGLEVKAEEGWSLLDTAKFYGLEIPTLCYNEGLAVPGGLSNENHRGTWLRFVVYRG